MEQKFSNNNIFGQGKRLSKADLQMLREFCEKEGELVAYHKGDQMEREGDPARWFHDTQSRFSSKRRASVKVVPRE